MRRWIWFTAGVLCGVAAMFAMNVIIEVTDPCR
jgi:hypothetical protein